ncbi:MAG: DNA recombination protein RmuC [Phyllobacteriaceae bacterium]|nr:DNA recombination protein RmuC [Phyllobacteriaceae bacterium]
MQDTIFLLAGHPVALLHLLFAAGGFVLGLVIAGGLGRGGTRARIAAETLAADQAAEVERRLAEIGRLQAETTGRMQTMAEVFGSRQVDLARSLTERLDGLGARIGHSLTDTGRATAESLTTLAERLAVIDRAQRGIADLSGEMLELKSILANKQARGAFGQGRMEAIVADALPAGAYEFQATLTTGVRPDCLVHLPGAEAALAIDAKFPLEGWSALREAVDAEARERAMREFRRDVIRHVVDVRDKYLVPGETHDVAFLFVPSEAIFADLHEQFADVVQRAHRARVVIVSPSLLLLAIQLVQSIGRDREIRSQAHVIQREVGALADDVARLGERVAKLQAHFGQATRDLDQLALSADKVVRRAARIEALDLDAEPPARLAGE